MHYRANVNPTGMGGIPIPSTVEEMIRIFPQLVSKIQQQEQRIAELESKIQSLEVIGGNVNQM